MTTPRKLAMLITLLACLAFWITSIVTLFYAVSHQADFPHHTNPYAMMGGFGLFPAAISTVFASCVWSDGINEAKGKR